jgi:hypothetical protein
MQDKVSRDIVFLLGSLYPHTQKSGRIINTYRKVSEILVTTSQVLNLSRVCEGLCRMSLAVS